MIKITKEQSIFMMSPKNAPVAYVEPGSVVCFQTQDCYSGRIRTEQDKVSDVPWEKINPAAGPLYIMGAKVNDVLRVEIQKIAIADKGVMAVGPQMGALGHLFSEERTKIIPIREKKAMFNERISLPICPMIGVIGTAPKDMDILNGTPGEHGSNMDCKRITEGSVLYLPVHVDGALLAIGDLHAVMGDGEVAICGVEIGGEVTVKVDVLKDFHAPLPMLETKDHIICIASGKTLDEAAKRTVENMAAFLQNYLGMDLYEAGMLMSAVCDLRISQMVDPLVTVRMELPKWIAEKNHFKMP